MAKTMTIEEKRRELEVKQAELFVIERLINDLQRSLYYSSSVLCGEECDGLDADSVIYKTVDESTGENRYIVKDSYYADTAMAELSMIDKLLAMV